MNLNGISGIEVFYCGVVQEYLLQTLYIPYPNIWRMGHGKQMRQKFGWTIDCAGGSSNGSQPFDRSGLTTTTTFILSSIIKKRIIRGEKTVRLWRIEQRQNCSVLCVPIHLIYSVRLVLFLAF